MDRLRVHAARHFNAHMRDCACARARVPKRGAATDLRVEGELGDDERYGASTDATLQLHHHTLHLQQQLQADDTCRDDVT